MLFLAQLRFDELPPLDGFPARGLPPTTGDEFEAALAAETGGRPDGSSRGASQVLLVRLTEDEALTHFVGGHPETTQVDARPSDVDASEIRVLLQLGWSGLGADRDWEVCFGDAGQAVFLATREGIEERRFGEASLYWDCA